MNTSKVDLKKLLLSPKYIQKCTENDNKTKDYNGRTEVKISKDVSYIVFNKKIISKNNVTEGMYEKDYENQEQD